MEDVNVKLAEEEGSEVDSECESEGGLYLEGIDKGPEMEGLTDAWGTPQSEQTLCAVGLNPGGLRKLHTSHSQDPDRSSPGGGVGLVLEVDAMELDATGTCNG